MPAATSSNRNMGSVATSFKTRQNPLISLFLMALEPCFRRDYRIPAGESPENTCSGAAPAV